MDGYIMFKTPLFINWSLSTKCNFQCQHCYSRFEKCEELSKEDNKKIINILAEIKIPFINFGGGEPLLIPELFEITLYAYNKGLHVSMSSNGYLLDNKMAQKIKEAGFSKVEISLDSHIQEIHDNFRNKKGSFNRVKRAVAALKNAGVTVDISTVICKINNQNFHKIVDFARELGVRKISLHNFKCSGLGFCNRTELDLTPLEWKEFYEQAVKIKKISKDIIISLDDPIISSLSEHPEFKEKTEAIVKGSICGKLSLAIKSNGDITPCGFLPLVIGNMLKDDILEVWQKSPVLEAMRNKKPKDKCQNCNFYTDCVGGCTSRAYALTGDINAPDPHCWIIPHESSDYKEG
ncbi:MAG: GeoRSP system radical SAM/SPASM protein [Candidatus Firestonebacteria bacterium]|nr:GeoRSP system radical SAM/SPASM protein [Candidatus Firestonebacteria bacterium]